MAFPVSPTEGQTYTENNTVWIYSSTAQQWFRSQVNPENETFYKFGGSASATGAAGEIQYTDGTNLAASPNLVWDDVNDELEVGGDVVLDDGGSFTTTLQTITPTANRTISLPNATGTVALVAGSSGQLVYNNAGAQAGVPGSTVGATGNVTLSLNGAASVSPFAVTGSWFAGTTPQVLIQPSNVGTAGSWSASGTGLGINAASGFSGRLLDLQLNGTSNFSVSSAGQVLVPNGTLSNPSYGFSANTDTGFYIRSTNQIGTVVDGALKHETSGNELTLFNFPLRFAPNTSSASDAGFSRSAAGVIRVTDGSTGDGTISGQLRAVGTAPATTGAAGTAGDIRYDADYIYICTATNTWKRAAISTW